LLSNQRSIYRKSRYPQFGLQLWLDGTAVEKFTIDEFNRCSLAEERGPFQRSFTQAVPANQPTYLDSAINSLPALRFDGSSQFMLFSDETLSWLSSSSFTVMYVATRTAKTSNSFVIGGQSTATRENLGLGYLTASSYRYVFQNDDITVPVPGSPVGQPELYTITFDSSNNERKVRRNGTLLGNDLSDGTLGTAMTGQSLGRYLSSFGQFDLGELLIYNRVLSQYERDQIQRDLASKWTISEAVIEYVVQEPEPEPEGPTVTATYSVINGMDAGTGTTQVYFIDGAENPALTLARGNTYEFVINSAGHPFWIQSVVAPYDAANVYNNGVTNNGTDSGTISFTVPAEAPDTLYYVCQNHASMTGTINIIG
jgi:plastocyanin